MSNPRTTIAAACKPTLPEMAEMIGMNEASSAFHGRLAGNLGAGH